MNLYKILSDNIEEQTKFCEQLINDIPKLIEYDLYAHGYCRIIRQNDDIDRLPVYLCKGGKLEYPYTSYNIFNVQNKPIKEWNEFISKWTVLNDMSRNKPINLQLIVKKWIITYEKQKLRNYKINKILKK